MISNPDGALAAALRRLADEMAPRLLAEAVAEAEIEFKDQLRSELVKALADSVAGTARPDAPEPLPASAPRGWYLYGITEGDAAAAISGLAGVEGSTTGAVVEGGLSAIVSEVAARANAWGMREDGEPDLDLLAPRVNEHETVLEQVLQHGSVLPVRFGTVYPSRQAVHRLLVEHAADITAGLARVRGEVEWGLSVTWDVARAVGSSAAEDASPGSRGSGGSGGADGAGGAGGPGRGYLIRQSAERARTEQLDRTRQRLAADLHDTIRSHATDSVVQPLRREVDGGNRQPLLRASYLVARSDTDHFRHAIVAGLDAAGAFGVDGELTGPWPPYSFAGLALTGAAS